MHTNSFNHCKVTIFTLVVLLFCCLLNEKKVVEESTAGGMPVLFKAV